MDTVSHGFWSALLWRADMWWFAVLFGVLPDVIAQTPKFLYNLHRNKSFTGVLSEDLPEGIAAYTFWAFHLTHSMIIASVLTGLVWIFFGVQWWMLAWHLHILVDMWTHRKEQATPFLYPVSDFRFHGVHWSSKGFVAVNFLLLASAWAMFLTP